MTTPAKKFLHRLAKIAANTKQQGDLFERLTQQWLQHAPPYKDQFRKVSLWGEWAAARNLDRRDVGIDLVAETIDGEYCAIQCKFYDTESTLYLGNLNNFIAALNSLWDGESFAFGLVVTTTQSWSVHTENSIKRSKLPCQRVDFLHELSDATIDWDKTLALLPDYDPDTTPVITEGVQKEMVMRREDAPVVDLPALLKQLRPQTAAGDKKQLRPHQQQALNDVLAGLKSADRGKLIMACGTGKTFTALKIAEKLARKTAVSSGNILFLVPSLSLLSQALLEWSAESKRPLRNFAVCSDSAIGSRLDQRRHQHHDLAIPATTDAKQLAAKLKQKTDRTNIVFATYHSIDVVAEAQKKGAPEFDLIICDEAHRTTGVDDSEVSGQRESYFTKVHDGEYVRAARRLYMTATPRMYTESAKKKAETHAYEIYSMDDPAKYGEELYRLDFSDAVQQGLLSDYKVIIVTLKEDSSTAGKLGEYRKIETNQKGRGKKYEVGTEDLVKIIGCWKGLAKKTDDPALQEDGSTMRRAVAFTSTINRSRVLKTLFPHVIKDYHAGTAPDDYLQCELRHVDGTQNALQRNQALGWLKQEPEENHCHILSNVRCLSEGVDVPALDAVLFLHPRKSEVDIVQSVGRVMRKAEGKNYGYIILPIITPTDISPEEALNNNETYKVVWQVLRALRSHDSRMDITINQLDLNKTPSDRIILIDDNVDYADNPDRDREKIDENKIADQLQQMELSGWQGAIFAKIVKQCGDREYWDNWAGDVAAIAARITRHIQERVDGSDKTKGEFRQFLSGLQKNLNPAVTAESAMEMLAQHIITRPVFDALFGGDQFVAQNPVSRAMQKMLDVLDERDLAAQTRQLDAFYHSVKRSIEGLDNPEGKQKIIVKLYEKFFQTGFPKMQEQLGIVYTPVEVVDFIVRSIDDLLQREFKRGISDENVNLLDPFTGTGTFITRLLQSDLIRDRDLTRKYKGEIHANEIVLLAYYIAAVNIEQAYQQRLLDAGQKNTAYAPFEGIALTDTFQINEGDDDSPQASMVPKILPINSARIERQKQTPITVVFGNPPYSAGQGSANDDNQNLKYEKLDASISETYSANHSTATLIKNSLYDSYIRAIRWASDRIGDEGIVAYISNGGYIDGNAMDGLRKCLAEEFSSIYCFNLRGNAQTSDEQRRKEKGNVFGEGTAMP